MIIFKRIEVDLDRERERIESVKYNKRQKTALLKLVDLFEQGKWQECLDHIHKAFPYNNREGYSEKEHVMSPMGDILLDLAHFNFYTSDQLLRDAEARLRKDGRI